MVISSRLWKTLIQPYKAAVELSQHSDRRLDIVIEPLDHGFGTTLGNAIRRVLLSAIPGAAVTSIKMDGVLHEFESLPFMREDVMDFITNLKGLEIRTFSDIPQRLILKAKKAGVITASHIECPGGVTILNPHHVLCTLEEGGSLYVEMTVETGKGYVSAVQQKEQNLAIDGIAIDAFFNPVKTVSFHVENTRIGRSNAYDKLILTVETNGAISPREAVVLASSILAEQLRAFQDLQLEEGSLLKTQASEKKPLPFSVHLLKRIDHLDLTIRAKKCIAAANMTYVGDLVKAQEATLLETPNFGSKSLQEIKTVLAKLKDETREYAPLTLGLPIPEWPPEDLDVLLTEYEMTT